MQQQASTEAANAAPPITSTTRLCIDKRAYFTHWLSVWMHAPNAFSFHIFADDSDVAPIYESPADYPNQMRAKIAAEEWIAARDPATDEHDVVAVPEKLSAGGWDLTLGEDSRHLYFVAIINPATGELPEPEFAGYLDRVAAMDAATAWATANPCDGSTAPESTEAGARFIHDGDDGPEENEGQAMPAEPEPTLEQLAAEADAAIADTTAPPCKGRDERGLSCGDDGCQACYPSAAPVYDPRVDEVWTLLTQRKDLRAQRVAATTRLELAKAQIKALTLEIEGLDGQLEDAHEDAPRQRTLPLAQAPLVDVAGAATKVADSLMPALERWAFNGVEHVIIVRQLGPDSWAAALQGHQEQTEGFAEKRDEAIEACKGRAAIVFEDTEPGTTEIRKPPKRGRKPKAPTSTDAADMPQVLAALRASMTLGEAAEMLGRSVKNLEKWAAENGVPLSMYLGAETGKDETTQEPAPKASKAKRSSRRSKGAK